MTVTEEGTARSRNGVVLTTEGTQCKGAEGDETALHLNTTGVMTVFLIIRTQIHIVMKFY